MSSHFSVHIKKYIYIISDDMMGIFFKIAFPSTTRDAWDFFNMNFIIFVSIIRKNHTDISWDSWEFFLVIFTDKYDF